MAYAANIVNQSINQYPNDTIYVSVIYMPHVNIIPMTHMTLSSMTFCEHSLSHH